LDLEGVVVARGLCSIDKIFELVGCKASFLLHKGKTVFVELEEARRRWGFDVVIRDSIVEKESFILEITNLRKVR
jgi:16S rRNA (guanine527-N7)-methyltransferase